MPRSALAAVCLVALALSAPAVAAERAPAVSWGKAGVAFETYRTDAVECAKKGYYLDIAQTDDAKAFVRGSRELDDVTQGGSPPPPGADPISESVRIANQYERIRRSVNPERRMDHLKTVLQSAVETCLTERGYTRFRLSPAQLRRLARMKIGSDERRIYMHALASDPAVLKSQAEAL